MAADGSHPGVFWPVVNDPKDYSTVGMVTLFLHEGVPGHHLHAALLKELNLPDRKFNTENSDTASYTEGWALYCETLGKEFGFYEHPDAYFGHLNNELLRAVRLVVDTGMHAQGWSREKAIAYAWIPWGTPKPPRKIRLNATWRWPAQALAYKIGAMKILELRERARQSLGDKFSYAKFTTSSSATAPSPCPYWRLAWMAGSPGSINSEPQFHALALSNIRVSTLATVRAPRKPQPFHSFANLRGYFLAASHLTPIVSIFVARSLYGEPI